MGEMMIWAQQSQMHFRAVEFTIDDDDGKKQKNTRN
jgi:regulator of PEP synthase PpsR (kinase-PPPase family)